jgi:hypothetical protein
MLIFYNIEMVFRMWHLWYVFSRLSCFANNVVQVHSLCSTE